MTLATEAHPLLLRQLNKVGLRDHALAPSPEVWAKLFTRLNTAYEQADQDRYTLERSLSLCSEEMQELNLRAERRSVLLRQQQVALMDLTRSEALQSEEIAGTLRHVTEHAARTLGVERVSIWRFAPDRSAIRCVDLFELTPGRHGEGAELSAEAFPGYFKALSGNEVIAADHAAVDSRTIEFASVYLAPLGITSMMDIPIFIDGNLEGVLCHEHVGIPRTWTADEQTFGISAANIVSLAYGQWEMQRLHKALKDQNRILEEKVLARTKELRETQYEVIQRLTRAAEFRDMETGEHINRMSRYCAVLGSRAGLDATACDLLLSASAMHDIGKIGIPDRILLKPGPLDPDEWAIMKTHCELGARLLEGNDSPLMKTARTIAWTHHERWDGTGYPRGLRGEEIPLEGRICALCDVFDALLSSRPYKQAWPLEKAVDEIVRSANSHFDPFVVECFKGGLEELTAR